MQLWGKWFAPDISEQLGTGGDGSTGGGSRGGGGGGGGGGEVAARRVGFDPHAWLRVCGVACAVGRCKWPSAKSRGEHAIAPCTEWLNHAAWNHDPLLDWFKQHHLGRRGGPSAEHPAREVPEHPAREAPVDASAIEAAAAARVAAQAPLSSPMAEAVAAARTSHSHGLVAFRYPISAAYAAARASARASRAHCRRAVRGMHAPPSALRPTLRPTPHPPPHPPPHASASPDSLSPHPPFQHAFPLPPPRRDRREYQIWVHVLMTAAMLTSRVPVLPLALCASLGEWSERSRCVYVLHDVAGGTYCVMRPPSPCYGKIALPNALEGAPPDDVAVAALPRLRLVNGTVDVRRLGAALGASGRGKRVLLLDPTALKRPDDLSNLLVTPKGWMCTLEHKSCQHAC